MRLKLILIIMTAALFIGGVLATSSRWEGDVTEAAAGPLAEKAGVEETQVLPWKLEGDLLLFVFLAGGATAGFAAGYSWRKLFSEKESWRREAPERDEVGNRIA
jgi:hypothetical protein